MWHVVDGGLDGCGVLTEGRLLGKSRCEVKVVGLLCGVDGREEGVMGVRRKEVVLGLVVVVVVGKDR